MSKLYDAILGLAIGDALGVPYEFKQRGSHQKGITKPKRREQTT